MEGVSGLQVRQTAAKIRVYDVALCASATHRRGANAARQHRCASRDSCSAGWLRGSESYDPRSSTESWHDSEAGPFGRSLTTSRLALDRLMEVVAKTVGRGDEKDLKLLAVPFVDSPVSDLQTIAFELRPRGVDVAHEDGRAILRAIAPVN